MGPARMKYFVNNAKSKMPLKLQQWADPSLRIPIVLAQEEGEIWCFVSVGPTEVEANLFLIQNVT